MSGEIRLALLGDPVGHSRSPAIHTAALGALGLAGSYEARRSDQTGLKVAVEELRRGDLTGLNITMPLKEAAAEAADVLTPMAQQGNTVNTMRARDGVVEGHTTDAAAMEVILGRPGFTAPTPILLLGAGGAAAALIQVMADREVWVEARKAERAQRLAAGRNRARVAEFGRPIPGAVVVNATSLGMQGESLPDPVLDEASALVDLVYGPRVPPATARARDLGLPVVDGVEFLALQAAASFTWWTGIQAPYPAMLAAARNG